MGYVYLPILVPTAEMLDMYKKKKGEWLIYERDFLVLMKFCEIGLRIVINHLM